MHSFFYLLGFCCLLMGCAPKTAPNSGKNDGLEPFPQALKKAYRWAIYPQFFMAEDYAEGFYKVAVPGTEGLQYQYINTKGDSICCFDDYQTSGFSHGLLLVERDYHHAYFLDSTGKTRIHRHFEVAYPFSEGLAVVGRDAMFGFINTQGDYVIQPTFFSAAPFSEGLAEIGILSDDYYNDSIEHFGDVMTKSGFIDKTGKIVIPAVYRDVSDFNDGVAWVLPDSLWGLIDRQGNWVLTPRYSNHQNDFYDGYALRLNKDSSNYISFLNKKGDSCFDSLYWDAYGFSEGLAAVQDTHYRWGFIDTKGELVIPCMYTDATPFSEGLAVVRRELDGNCGFINHKNETVIPFDFMDAHAPQQGRAAVFMPPYGWGFLDVGF